MKRYASLLVVLALFLMTAVAFAAEWTGEVVKKDDKLWFKSGENTYSITNPDKAKDFEGKKVTAKGTEDAATKSIMITKISEVAAS